MKISDVHFINCQYFKNKNEYITGLFTQLLNSSSCTVIGLLEHAKCVSCGLDRLLASITDLLLNPVHVFFSLLPRNRRILVTITAVLAILLTVLLLAVLLTVLLLAVLLLAILLSSILLTAVVLLLTAVALLLTVLAWSLRRVSVVVASTAAGSLLAIG